ncbi:MAG: hypothetical protein AAB583_03655 [Patescibacteria group bacterium]
MWEEIDFKAYNPHASKIENVHIEGINRDGLLVSRAAEFAIVVEMQIIRDIMLGRIRQHENKGQITDIENQVNFFTLGDMTFFNYKNREIVFLHPAMGAPMMECTVQNASSLGVKYFVRLGTTGSLNRAISKYSFIVTTSSIRNDGTSDHYLPIGFPAISSKTLNQEIVREFKKNKIPHIEGVSFTTETRFKEDVPYLLDLNKKYGVTNIEMESATLFSVATELGIHSSSMSMVTDCLADENELKNVEGTLVGVPKYQELMDTGVKRLTNAFDAILEAFSGLPSNSKRYKELMKEINGLNPNAK